MVYAYNWNHEFKRYTYVHAIGERALIAGDMEDPLCASFPE